MAYWDPSGVSTGNELADEFVRLCCLTYDASQRADPAKARAMLDANPGLAQKSIFTAAAAGDVGALRASLARDASLVNAKGGTFRWEPLLYACYSRLDTLDVARILLEAGADPNARFLWRGNSPPFTALTGAFGEGEDGANQPPHPQWRALARLLLDAGADANDAQTLYNRHFNRGNEHLELLFEYGLSEPRMLVEELWAAAKMNDLDRAKLLVARGTDVNTPGCRNGRTPWTEAMLAGNLEIADFLSRHGARRIELSAKETFIALCAAGRRDDVLAMPPQKLSDRDRAELLHRVSDAHRIDALRLLQEIGFDINMRIDRAGLDRTILHNAAWSGDLEWIRALLALGADPNVRDLSYDATPAGWAEHNRQREAAAFLSALQT